MPKRKPLKCWVIIREDLKYSYESIFNIGIQNIVLPFFSEYNPNIREEWINDGTRVETFTMFNISFIEELEKDLIESGHIYKWIYDKKIAVGILIEPTRFQFKDTLLQNTLTLKQYSKHRMSQFNEKIVEKDDI